MMNEEEYIRQKMGERNPFTVPEGYFDQLSQQIIDKLPPAEEAKPKPRAIERYLKPLLYAAACLAIAVMGTAIYTNRHLATDQQQLAQQETVTYSDSYIDEAADYVMLDNAEIYNSLLAGM